MCLSLVACGGPDKQPAIDAYNKAADALENDKLDQSVLDELVTQCQTIEELALDLKSDMGG